MDAQDALKQLLDVSEEVGAAVVFERGEPIASSLSEQESTPIAQLADAMLAYAATLRKDVAPTRLRAATPDGDVYVVRQGERAVVAVAAPGSLAGLVQHDLRTLLASVKRARGRAVVAA